MGQAKLRKSEIAALKAQSADLNIVAIRHMKNGQREVCTFSVEKKSVPAMPASKPQLVTYICTNKWLHNPPAMAIAGYLLMTDSYKFFKMLGKNVYGYVMNFYEQDIVRTDKCSCREIIALGSQEQWDAYVKSTLNTLKAANDMDIKKRA